MRRQFDTRIEGIGNLPAGNYHNILVEGTGTFRGDIEFNECKIEGIGKALGNLKGNCLEIEGTFKVEKDIRVKELDVAGMLRTRNSKIYADRICIEGMLTNDGEVSADIIEVEGLVRTPSLLGDRIKLNYSEIMRHRGLGLFLGIRNKMQGVDTIECTQLQASYLKCKRICAQEIYLSDHCIVEHIECDGDIYIDGSCQINSISGDYRLHR